MAELLFEQVKYEKEKWDKEFKTELIKLKRKFKLFPCGFWELYYREITEYLDGLLRLIPPPLKILEVGCGSGKGSLLLKTDIETLTLVDISEEALKLAQFFANKLKRKNIKYIQYIQADLFKFLPLSGLYDLVWNSGTLEHYDEPFIEKILKEMARVTKKGGYLVIGLPNPKSLAYKKAKFLSTAFGRRWLKFIPGYRIESEKGYSPEVFSNFFKSLKGYNFQDVNITYVGSYLLRDTPGFILRISRYGDLFFKKYKFSYLISAKKL